MSKLVDYVLIRNFNSYLLDTDLMKILDFGQSGNHKIYRIVDAMAGYTIGAVEYALVAKGIELRIGLNSAYRNQGLASNILKDVVEKLGNAFPNTKYLVCYISLDNKASLKMIKKSGFNPNEDDMAMEEGYQEYLLLNPYFQTEKRGNDKINFIDAPEEDYLFKLELRGVRPHKVRVKRTYDGMEIIPDLQDDINCNIIRFVETLTGVIYSLAPLYPSSKYFTFILELNAKAHPMNYIKLFSLYGFELDTLESSDRKLVFKYPNPEYRISVKDVLTRGIIKEKNND